MDAAIYHRLKREPWLTKHGIVTVNYLYRFPLVTLDTDKFSRSLAQACLKNVIDYGINWLGSVENDAESKHAARINPRIYISDVLIRLE